MIKTTTNEMITNLIESMTVDEMKERLAQYMLPCSTPRASSAEVWLTTTTDRSENCFASSTSCPTKFC